MSPPKRDIYGHNLNTKTGLRVCEWCGREKVRGIAQGGGLKWFDVKPDEKGRHPLHAATCPGKSRPQAPPPSPLVQQATNLGAKPIPDPPGADLQGGRADRDEALDDMEAKRADWIKRARLRAAGVIRDQGHVTSDDIHAVCAVPNGVNPKVMGAVFRAPFVKMGPTIQTTRRVAHARPIQRWTLSWADLARMLREEEPPGRQERAPQPQETPGLYAEAPSTQEALM